MRTRFVGPPREALASETGTKLNATLDYVESEAHRFSMEQPEIGSLGIGAASGYLNFWFGVDAWRKGKPALSEQYEEFARCPSFVATAPADKWMITVFTAGPRDTLDEVVEMANSTAYGLVAGV